MSEAIELAPPAVAEWQQRRRRLPFSPWHLFLVPLTFVMLFPMLWMVVTSIETEVEARHFPPILIPQTLRLLNYPDALRAAPFATFFLNSSIVAISVVLTNLVFCSLAGYAFARITFRGSGIMFLFLLATLMIPSQVTLIPQFLVVKWLGEHVSPLIGVNSLGALILPDSVQVFAIFMLRQFFRTLPIELEEAARIDGASRLRTLFKVVLPLSLPALSTLAALLFLYEWNDFLWPLIALQSSDRYTIQLGLAYFQGEHNTQLTLLMAGNVMSLIPMLVIFFLAQRYFIRSVATAGLKG